MLEDTNSMIIRTSQNTISAGTYPAPDTHLQPLAAKDMLLCGETSENMRKHMSVLKVLHMQKFKHTIHLLSNSGSPRKSNASTSFFPKHGQGEGIDSMPRPMLVNSMKFPVVNRICKGAGTTNSLG